MMLGAAALAWLGAAVAIFRLSRGPDRDPSPPSHLPSASIIIPARNEERNLPALLASLRAIDYPDPDIIVIDDNSTDRTAEIARAAGVRVIPGKPLPPGWMGKNWACHQAAAEAKGDVLLFTDADTVHKPDGLRRAVAFLHSSGADLVSALPYHTCPTWWERLMGPFHALVLVATAHRRPRRRRLYAVGQFLLFRRSFYDRIGGHAAVAARYPDDLALADETYAHGGRYAFFAGRPYFTVRMYSTFAEFFQGWRRNVAAGLRIGHWSAAVEVSLVIAALFAAGHPEGGPLLWLPLLAVVGVIGWRQRHWGQFAGVGAVLYPFAVLVHCVVTMAAVVDLLRGGRLQWKGRTLTAWSRDGSS